MDAWCGQDPTIAFFVLQSPASYKRMCIVQFVPCQASRYPTRPVAAAGFGASVAGRLVEAPEKLAAQQGDED